MANATVVAEPVETAVPALKATDDTPMRTIGSPSLVRSLFRLGLVDRVRVMVFPIIRGATGEGPTFAELPDLDLDLTGTQAIDDRLVVFEYRMAGRPRSEDLVAGREHPAGVVRVLGLAERAEGRSEVAAPVGGRHREGADRVQLPPASRTRSSAARLAATSRRARADRRSGGAGSGGGGFRS